MHTRTIGCIGYTSNFKTLISSCVDGDIKISMDHLSIPKTKLQIEHFDVFFGDEFDHHKTEELEAFLEVMVDQADPDDF